ncbi:hypothetical protein SESBI_39638 [Sesbania bispinosa]|nr:hypothetical protein SESBI_39638 [Sesbania bispinosa]
MCRFSLAPSELPHRRRCLYHKPQTISKQLSPSSTTCCRLPACHLRLHRSGAVATGYWLSSRLGGSLNAALGGAFALEATSGAAAYALKAFTLQVVALNLHDYIAGFDDPSKLKKEDIEAIANKYGANEHDKAFKVEISVNRGISKR